MTAGYRVPLAGCGEHVSLTGTGQGVGGKADNGDVPVPFLPAAKHFCFFFGEIPIPTGHTQAGSGEGGEWSGSKHSRRAGCTQGHKGRD